MQRLRWVLPVLAGFALWLAGFSCAGAGELSDAQRAARARFRTDRFGMFIHWGIYSQLGDGEWVLNNHKMTLGDYEPLTASFRPQAFDARTWVDLAQAAGMRYITITAKHHDGFCMFGTKETDWNLVSRSPLHRDLIKELADECQKCGVRLFFYYSQLDWHHPDYFPRGRTGWNTGRPEAGQWETYLDFADRQLTELLTGYGPVAGIWFDGWWDKPEANWRLDRTYALIHRLQPGALVGNNHHHRPFPGEDIQMFEKDLPGQNASGLNAQNAVADLPLESCDTVNRAWGYNAHDRTFKSPRDLIQTLVRAAGADANFLLNVGPRPDGTIQPEVVERLKAIGQWLGLHGRSIYGTRGGPVPPQAWGVTTRSEPRGKVFVHVLDRAQAGARLVLPGLGFAVKSAHTWEGKPLPFAASSAQTVTIALANLPDDPIDAIIVLEP